MKSISQGYPFLLFLFILTSLSACGEKSSRSDQSPSTLPTLGEGVNQNENIESDGSNVQGFYEAPIWPVNVNLHLKQIGVVGFSRLDDEARGLVKLNYGPRSVRVKISILTARRCPNLNDDLNGDAFIDIEETKKMMGQVLIPLDDNLETQELGDFPATTSSGQLNYSQRASFDKLFLDLKAIDPLPMDDLIKLGPEDGFTLPGRIVIIQGASSENLLPSTVATDDTGTAYQTLPVGCAVLWKVGDFSEELKKVE
jgi:hypothetical protein